MSPLGCSNGFNIFSFYLILERMARRVKEANHKISVLTDIQFMDFTELDAYFQTIY